MEASVYIAKIAAVFYLCVGLCALLDKNSLKHVIEDLIKSPGAAYIGSIFTLVLGFGLLYVNSAWIWNLTVIITILGWGAIIKGVFGLLFPDYTLRLTAYSLKVKSLYLMVGVACILLGLGFGYFGFLG